MNGRDRIVPRFRHDTELKTPFASEVEQVKPPVVVVLRRRDVRYCPGKRTWRRRQGRHHQARVLRGRWQEVCEAGQTGRCRLREGSATIVLASNERADAGLFG